MTAVPLAEAEELNDPQVAALLPGVQLQVTPSFAESLATVALMDSVSLTYSDVGVVLSVTLMGGGAGVMAMVGRLANAAVLVAEVAVIVTSLTAVVGAL